VQLRTPRESFEQNEDIEFAPAVRTKPSSYFCFQL
jgi:hypothetical protein